MMELTIYLNSEKFTLKFIEFLKKKSIYPVNIIIKKIMTEQISEALSQILENKDILKAKFKILYNMQSKYPMYLTAYQDIEHSHLNWGLSEFEINTKKGLGPIKIIADGILSWLNPIEFNKYLQEPWMSLEARLRWTKPVYVEMKELKTLQKYRFRINNLGISLSPITKSISFFSEPCPCHESYLFPFQHVPIHFLVYICRICGKHYVCECFREVFRIYLKEADSQKSNFGEQGWPHIFLKLSKKCIFRKSICHLCTGEIPEYYKATGGYGSSLYPYSKKFELLNGLNRRDAENKVRQMLGIPLIGEKWIAETTLFKRIEKIYKEHEVIHQSSPDWLSNQWLDIYIPSLKLAIEYQGLQHFKPVGYFGGEEGLEKTKERDLRKKKLCDENGVTLVYFAYNEDTSSDFVQKKIDAAKKKRDCPGQG